MLLKNIENFVNMGTYNMGVKLSKRYPYSYYSFSERSL